MNRTFINWSRVSVNVERLCGLVKLWLYRFVDTAGRLHHYAGTQCPCPPGTSTAGTAAPCPCSGAAVLRVPSAVALTPDGVVHVADTGLACVQSAVGAEPTVDRYGRMKIVDAAAREVRCTSVLLTSPS